MSAGPARGSYGMRGRGRGWRGRGSQARGRGCGRGQGHPSPYPLSVVRFAVIQLGAEVRFIVDIYEHRYESDFQDLTY